MASTGERIPHSWCSWHFRHSAILPRRIRLCLSLYQKIDFHQTIWQIHIQQHSLICEFSVFVITSINPFGLNCTPLLTRIYNLKHFLAQERNKYSKVDMKNKLKVFILYTFTFQSISCEAFVTGAGWNQPPGLHRWHSRHKGSPPDTH